MSNTQWKKPGNTESTGGSIEFIRPKKLSDEGFEGVLFEGTYLESIPNKYDENKNDFKFEKEGGDVVIINGAGNLGYRMKEVSPGDYCQVTYEGKKEITSGKYKGTPSHSFDVLIA